MSAALTTQAQGGVASPDTGVFVGVSQLEYAALSIAAGSRLNAYHATGAHLSATSGRVSFAFGLTGPAITVGVRFTSKCIYALLCCRKTQIAARCGADAPHFRLVINSVTCL